MFTRFIIPVLFLTVLILGGYWLWSAIQAFRIRRKVLPGIRKLEDEYLFFISEREILAELQGSSLSAARSSVLSEAMGILLPHIDALEGTLETIPAHKLPSSVRSDLFPNILTAYRNIWNAASPDRGLTQDDRKMFRQAVSDALYADLSRRFLMLQTGASL